MPFFELLHRLESRGLVISHVLVPSLIELCELKFLGAFHGSQLLFLGDAHVFRLPRALHLAELLEAVTQVLGTLVFALFLTAFPELIYHPSSSSSSQGGEGNLLEECDQLLIWEEVHALLGEEDIVHPPIRLTQVLTRVRGRTLGHLGGMGQLLVHRGLL